MDTFKRYQYVYLERNNSYPDDDKSKLIWRNCPNLFDSHDEADAFAKKSIKCSQILTRYPGIEIIDYKIVERVFLKKHEITGVFSQDYDGIWIDDNLLGGLHEMFGGRNVKFTIELID